MIISLPYKGWHTLVDFVRPGHYEVIGTWHKKHGFRPHEDKIYSPEDLVRIAQRIDRHYRNENINTLIKELKENGRQSAASEYLLRAAIEIRNNM